MEGAQAEEHIFFSLSNFSFFFLLLSYRRGHVSWVLCMCVFLCVCFFLSTFLVRSGHGLIWAAASRILVLCFSGYPPLPPVAGAFSALEGSRGVGACRGGRSGWVVTGLAALWQGVEEGWVGLWWGNRVVFRLFPPSGWVSSTVLSRPRRLGVSEREVVESR